MDEDAAAAGADEHFAMIIDLPRSKRVEHFIPRHRWRWFSVALKALR